MKKILKRSLAIVLAILMISGGSIAASAAFVKPQELQRDDAVVAPAAEESPDWNLTITKQPTDTSFTMFDEYPNLSGMEISVSGGIFTTPTTVKYDDVAGVYTPGPDKILWFFKVIPDFNYADDWVEGSNNAVLIAEAWQCKDFHVVKTVNGVEYGYYDQEFMFYAYTYITVIATSEYGDRLSAKALTVDVPETVTVTDGYCATWFKFTAPQDGFYRFQSDGGLGSDDETLYSREGDILEVPYLNPYACLFDEDGGYLDYDHYSDGFRGDLNFRLFQQTKQGETVYLRTSCYSGAEDANYTITVNRIGDGASILKLKSYEIANTFHDVISINTLLEGSGFDHYDVQLQYNCDYFIAINYLWTVGSLYSIQPGESHITIVAPDGSVAEVNVTISYSTSQWLCIIFFGGSNWLKYTQPGPLNLGNLIELFRFGMGNALYELFSNLGVPDQWISWLLNGGYEIKPPPTG